MLLLQARFDLFICRAGSREWALVRLLSPVPYDSFADSR